MKKKEYIKPEAEVVAVNGDTLMGDEWWSVNVDPNEEIDDDDIGAKPGFFETEDWEKPRFNPWED